MDDLSDATVAADTAFAGEAKGDTADDEPVTDNENEQEVEQEENIDPVIGQHLVKGKPVPFDIREEKAKAAFYTALCKASDIAANVAGRSDGLGPYTALKIGNYEQVGRDASDEFFDNLCEVDFLKKLLFKATENKLVDKWGACLLLGYTMYMSFDKERDARIAVLMKVQAEQQAKADAPEQDDKDKAA